MEPSSDRAAPEDLWLVVAHYGIEVLVRAPNGEERRAGLGRQKTLVVGDRVILQDGLAYPQPRIRSLQRRDRRGRVRTVAANLDGMGIVLAPVPDTPDAFVDRAIVGARAVEIEPFFVVNKMDLEGSTDVIDRIRVHWPGVEPILPVSATGGLGLEALRAHFGFGQRGVFVGVSGVGKSSLMNALVEEAELAVGEINPQSELGRHVTTNATLHRLSEGGELIDTPGFRDFGPVAVSAVALASYFPGFEQALSVPCRYRNCRHRVEPDCAVLRAVEDGSIDASRHSAYVALQEELAEAGP